jgi:transcriptional regulator
MYIPTAFRVEDRPLLYDLIDRYSFATLVSTVDGAPFATHLPVLLDRARDVLLAHVARANPHWRAFDGRSEALALFQGPHAYVSPSWYAVAPAVPTWDYAAVHVRGVPRLLTDVELSDLLDRLVTKYESGRPRPWRMDLPADYRRKMTQAVVGFEVPVTHLEGKFKFSQNRSAEDRAGVLRELEAGDGDARALAALMRHVLQE